MQEGKDMGAKFTLLTHFSQRYSKIPVLDEIEGQDNVGIAFDNMVVNPETMKNIPATYPALKRCIFINIFICTFSSIYLSILSYFLPHFFASLATVLVIKEWFLFSFVYLLLS